MWQPAARRAPDRRASACNFRARALPLRLPCERSASSPSRRKEGERRGPSFCALMVSTAPRVGVGNIAGARPPTGRRGALSSDAVIATVLCVYRVGCRADLRQGPQLIPTVALPYYTQMALKQNHYCLGPHL